MPVVLSPLLPVPVLVPVSEPELELAPGLALFLQLAALLPHLAPVLFLAPVPVAPLLHPPIIFPHRLLHSPLTRGPVQSHLDPLYAIGSPILLSLRRTWGMPEEILAAFEGRF